MLIPQGKSRPTTLSQDKNSVQLVVKHSWWDVDMGYLVRHLQPSDFHKYLIWWPCFNHRLDLLDACMERSHASIFVWISQIDNENLNLWWSLGFECSIGEWLSTWGSRSFCAQSVLDFYPILLQPLNFNAITPEVTPTGRFQMPPCFFNEIHKNFVPASMLDHAFW